MAHDDDEDSYVAAEGDEDDRRRRRKQRQRQRITVKRKYAIVVAMKFQSFGGKRRYRDRRKKRLPKGLSRVSRQRLERNEAASRDVPMGP